MSSAWETIRSDSRQSPRYKLGLTASVSIDAGLEERHLPTVLACTRAISRDGLSLIMLTAGLGCHDLQERGHALQITLALPTGATIELEGQVVYCLPFKGGDLGREYLVGIKITGPISKDRTIYSDFIENLSRSYLSATGKRNQQIR
jgi:hypothetical protein